MLARYRMKESMKISNLRLKCEGRAIWANDVDTRQEASPGQNDPHAGDSCSYTTGCIRCCQNPQETAA